MYIEKISQEQVFKGFVVLNNPYDEREIRIAIDSIAALSVGKNFTDIYVQGIDKPFAVKQSVEEIVKRIDEVVLGKEYHAK